MVLLAHRQNLPRSPDGKIFFNVSQCPGSYCLLIESPQAPVFVADRSPPTTLRPLYYTRSESSPGTFPDPRNLGWLYWWQARLKLWKRHGVKAIAIVYGERVWRIAQFSSVHQNYPGYLERLRLAHCRSQRMAVLPHCILCNNVFHFPEFRPWLMTSENSKLCIYFMSSISEMIETMWGLRTQAII